jgi:hypothetical protein
MDALPIADLSHGGGGNCGDLLLIFRDFDVGRVDNSRSPALA